MRAALDTCGGCNFIGRNQIPLEIAIKPFSKPTRHLPLKGTICALGEVKRLTRFGTIQVVPKVEVLVVDQFVLPLLLGTPGLTVVW